MTRKPRDADPPAEGHNSGDTAAHRLERLITLETERRSIGDDIKELLIEAEADGQSPQALWIAMRLHFETGEARMKREAAEREADELLAAIGPLGEAAVKRGGGGE
jgi:uncharacterized protein (UPF0335 family)